MTRILFALILMAVLAMGVSACTDTRGPGKYERTSTSTDAYGTTRETKTTTEVDVDRDGDKTITTETKKSTDPKGLFNKTTTKSKEVIEEEH